MESEALHEVGHHCQRGVPSKRFRRKIGCERPVVIEVRTNIANLSETSLEMFESMLA